MRNPPQRSLGLLDVVVERNSYGRQVDSFVATLESAPALSAQAGDEPLEGVFIRAPRILELGPGVEVLARCGPDPVLVREGRVIAASFHPELGEDPRVAGLLLAAARASAGGEMATAS